MAHPLPQAAAILPTAHPAVAAETEAGNAAANDQLAWLATYARKPEPDRFRFLLLLRFALINVIGFALLAVAWLHGLVDLVIESDPTMLSVGIAGVFFVGLAICTQKVWQTSTELNETRQFDPLAPSRAARYVALMRGRQGDSRAMLASAMRMKLTHRIAVVRHIANSLVLLGLIGTVVGFIIALSGVDPAKASDIKAVAPMVSTLVSGMSTALYTTLVGSVLSVWLVACYQLLATGTVKLITALVELGEAHARA